MINISSQIHRWFFTVILLSVLCMPLIMNLNIIPKLVIPSLILIWSLFVIKRYDLSVPKQLVWLVGLIIFGQIYIAVTQQTHSISGIMLGLIWLITATALWSMMQHLYVFKDEYYTTFALVALLWGVLGLYVWLGFTEGAALSFFGLALTHEISIKPAGPFANGNVLSILMLNAWVITFYFWMFKEKGKVFWYTLSLFFLAMVFTSLSRGTWLAWLPVAFILTIWFIKQRKWRPFWMLCLNIVTSILLAYLLVENTTTSYSPAEQFDNLLSGNSLRLVLYPSVFAVWLENPIFGVGFDNLIANFLTGQASALQYLPSGFTGMGATSNAHNHLLQLVSEAGVIGLFVWLVVSYILLKGLFKSFANVEAADWLPFTLAFVLWLQGFVNISMYEPMPFFLFFLFLGIGVRLQSVAIEGYKVPKFIFTAFVIISVFILSFQSVKIFQNWKLYEGMFLSQSASERVAYIKPLLNYEHTYPRVVMQVVLDFEYREAKAKEWVAIIPLIERAISLEEWPILYKALLLSYTKKNDWDRACDISKFIQRQKWANDTNLNVYESICRNHEIKDFHLE